MTSDSLLLMLNLKLSLYFMFNSSTCLLSFKFALAASSGLMTYSNPEIQSFP
ncbi:hypothetical protein MtrunA17_Chr3g0086101 [Medicago truncatula]|uniref:Uncharacterized protein n=1 Tax=Medicago truncatula TaxID=3880 RepID=A0A396IK06_MEDTR|nr:hypothetical protein MtrunA17_Chr3g0086101 [Medicago truncatula]